VTATVDLHLRDNSVQNIDDNTAFPFGAAYDTRIESRHDASLCLDMASNTSAHVGAKTDFRVRQRDASLFRMERLTDNDGTPKASTQRGERRPPAPRNKRPRTHRQRNTAATATPSPPTERAATYRRSSESRAAAARQRRRPTHPSLHHLIVRSLSKPL
jgi:hypothetical protein